MINPLPSGGFRSWSFRFFLVPDRALDLSRAPERGCLHSDYGPDDIDGDDAASSGSPCSHVVMTASKKNPHALTKAQAKQLAVLRDSSHRWVPARWFARSCWPDSPGWTRNDHCGRTGTGPTLAAGTALSRLFDRGFASRRWAGVQYLGKITPVGKRALADHLKAEPFGGDPPDVSDG